MLKTNKKYLALSVLAAAVLVGCGGGGGGENTAGNPSTPTTPATPESGTGPSLQTSVPAPTYAAGSEEAAAWEVLNQARQVCGFGMLAQDTRLDAAARAHVDYLKRNNKFEHYETAGLPGFTGADPMARAKAQGFDGVSVGELLSGDSEGALGMAGLMTAPYHLSGAMDGSSLVGFGVNGMVAVNTGNKNFGDVQKLGRGVVAHYPCDEATAVSTGWSLETPDPMPDLKGTTKGTPVIIRGDAGSTISITNLSIVRASTGESVSFRSLTSANDPNSRIGRNEYIAMPIKRLEFNETYQVTYQGTIDGTQIGKTFTFKTSIMSGVRCKDLVTGELSQCDPE